MRLALKIVAAALSVLAIVTGIVFTIPQSRELVINTLAEKSKVYEEQLSLNQELENQKSMVSNELVNLQNQKQTLENIIEILENDSTADKQLIQNYINEVEELNRQIQNLENIRVSVNNGSITYRGSYSGFHYWVFDDNDMPIYQNYNAGTHYGENQYMGEHLMYEIDHYVSEIASMQKSLSYTNDTILYSYNVYQIVIGPYGLMWDQHNVEHRFASDAVIDLEFIFNAGNINADDLKTLIDNYSHYNVKIDYSFDLNADGLISSITCNFKVTSN